MSDQDSFERDRARHAPFVTPPPRREVDDELKFHLDQRIQEYVREHPGAATPATTTQPTSLENDPTLRQYLAERSQIEANLFVLKRHYGSQHPAVRNTQAYLEKIDQQIATYSGRHPSPIRHADPDVGVSATHGR